MIDLRDKIRNIINRETENNHFSVLDLDKSVELIQQIFENYEVLNDLKQDFSNLPKKGNLIFIAAPTGAGKNNLVIKFNVLNPDKKYIELNMDIFRHYFPLFISNSEEFNDKNFADKTNEFSYEIYMTIQEILINEFPGTNIIITGTLRETDWIEEAFKLYKESKVTDYKIKLVSLVVPKKASAVSVLKRYLSIIDGQKYFSDFKNGTARYTSFDYHEETYIKFPENLGYFETIFKNAPGKLLDDFEVYRRSKDLVDYVEDTLEYSSEKNIFKLGNSALETVLKLRDLEYNINEEDKKYIENKINENYEYLKSQQILDEVENDFKLLLEG